MSTLFLLNSLSTSTPTALVDKNGVVFAVLVGQPAEHTSWDDCIIKAGLAIKTTRRKLRLQSKLHKRGTFATVRTSVSLEGGQTEPMNCTGSPSRWEALRCLFKNPTLGHIGRFMNSKSQCDLCIALY